MKNPWIEVSKEVGRWAALGVVGWLLTSGVLNSLVIYIFGSSIDPQLQMILITGMTAVLRKVDEILHNIPEWTPYGEENRANGILWF